MRRRLVVLLVLFVASGMAGLIYEVVWIRLFGRVMGNTVFSMTTVLSAFMAGLALGAAWGGRWASRSARPVRTYALLELAIGLYCLAVPSMVDALTPVCRWLYQDLYDQFLLFHLLLFGLGGAILVPVTALMGATLPFLARAIGPDERLGTRLGDLYAANTVGAVLGVLLAGFALVPALGLLATNRLAAALNGLVALVGLAVAGSIDGRVAVVADEEPVPADLPLGRRPAAVLYLAFAASGATSLAYQIAWTRSLTMVIGMSTYAFTTIVGAFILGIALGSAALGRLADRTGRPVALLVGSLALAGLAGPLSPALLGRLPVWFIEFVYADPGASSFGGKQAVVFAALFACLLGPTALFGGAFPLVGRALAAGRQDGRRVARIVGRAYAANTLGSIVGSVACGFVLVPVLGIEGALRAAGALSLAAAVALALVALEASLVRRLSAAAIVAALGLAAVVAGPSSDPSIMGSGAYLYGPVHVQEARRTHRDVEAVLRGRGEVVSHREGISTTVQVKRHPTGRGQPPALVLLVNGKPEATTVGDMRTQTLLGQLATLFHPAPSTGLVIGLGGGLTLASMATHDLDSIDVLEISPAVAEAARDEFGPANGHVLERDEVHLIVGDGRTHVAFGAARYDVISSQPSNPWIAGVASLFTEEFFGLVRERLTEGGFFCQWVQAYRMSVDDFRMIVRTFRRVFPDAYLFKSQTVANVASGDFLLVGGRGAAPSMAALGRAMADRPAVAADLASVDLPAPIDVVEGLVLGPDGLAAFAGDGPVNTDDNAHLEFSSPKSFYDSGAPILAALLEHRGRPPAWWAEGGVVDPSAAERRFRAMTDLLAGIVDWNEAQVAWNGRRWREAFDAYEAALERVERAAAADPGRAPIGEFRIRLLGERAGRYRARGRIDDARRDYERVLALEPDRPEALLKLGEIFAGKQLLRRAEDTFRRVTALESVDPLFVADAHANLAVLYRQGDRTADALVEIERALAIEPDHVHALYLRGGIEFEEGDLAAALASVRRAVEAGGDRTEVQNLFADLLHLSDRDREAMAAYRVSLEIEPDQGAVHRKLAEVLFEGQSFDEAIEHADRARELGEPVDETFYRNLERAAGR